MKLIVRVLFMWAAIFVCGTAAAASPPAHAPESAALASQPPEFGRRRFVTNHRGTFGGVDVAYTATAEDTIIPNGHGDPAGALFSFSYVRQNVKDPASRAVLFIFNGGPGSSSLWLHVGALGPYRVSLKDAVHPPTAGPFRIAPNPPCPLDVADLVFVDPVGTGFSHVIGDGHPEDFYGVEEDGKATLNFIEQWLTRNHRWSSPKFVVGESYGTVRAAVLAKLMGGGPSGTGTLPGVSLNGIAVVGVGLSLPSADVAAQGLLPSLAATGWYHGKIEKKGRTFDAFMHEVREFNGAEYSAALYAGTHLPDAQRRIIASRIATMTGLSESYVLDHNLRITAHDYSSDLLQDQRKYVGIYDGRFTLPSDGDAGDPVADDPAMGQYSAAFVAAFHQYVGDELQVNLDQSYQVIAFAEVNSKWLWGPQGMLANHADDLAAAMRRNPAMKLYVMSGYYDLATPFAQAEYTIGHTSIPAERVRYKTYESGHMVYLGDPNVRAFTADIRELVTSSSTERVPK